MQGYSISFTLGKASMVHGGNIRHNNRDFIAGNVISENTDENITYREQDIEKAYHDLFDDSLEEYNKKQYRKDRIINDYYEHIKNSKREEHFYEAIIQFGNVDDTPCGSERGKLAQQMLDEYMKDFERRNPNLHVFNAVLHLDEASPHLHIDFIPFYKNGKERFLKKGVSMKSALDEQGFKAKGKMLNRLVAWEASERNAMEKILNRHGYERDNKNDHHKHQSVEDYKMMMKSQDIHNALKKKFRSENNDVTKENLLNLKSKLAATEKENAELKEKNQSSMKSFYYSDSDKHSYIMELMKANNIPFVETEFGFNAQQCYMEQIRKWEKEFKSPKNFRSIIADDIDSLLMKSKDVKELYSKLHDIGYEIKHSGIYVSVKHPDSKRFVRLKSISEEYSEQSLINRINFTLQFEKNLSEKIEQAQKKNLPNCQTLQTIRFYTITFKKGIIFMRKKNKAKPFSWKNDAELDKLLALNRMLRDGETLESMKDNFKKYEKQMAECEDVIKDTKKKVEHLYRGQQAFEFIFESKHADSITQKEAMLYQEAHKNINAYNYTQIAEIVNDARKELKEEEEKYNDISKEIENLSGAISIYEKVHAGTYVQELVRNNNVRELPENLKWYL